MTSSGMRYSNIEPLQESSAGPPPVPVSSRPRLNQCSCGQFSLGDGDEAAEARFGGEQVVVAGVEAVVGDVVADAEEMAVFVVEEVVIDVGQFAISYGELADLGEALGCSFGAGDDGVADFGGAIFGGGA